MGDTLKETMNTKLNKTNPELIELLIAELRQFTEPTYQQCQRQAEDFSRIYQNSLGSYQNIFLNSRNDGYYESDGNEEEADSDIYSDRGSEMSADSEDSISEKDDGQPVPPKKPLSAFFIYKDDVFEEIRRANPGKTDTELTYLVSAQWRECSQETRRNYENKLQRAKKRYEEDLRAFEDRYGRGQNKNNKRTFVYKRSGDESDEEYIEKRVKPT